jgi:hypothetical protein
VSGALLVAVGLLLLTDSLQWLNDLFSGVLPDELG